MNLNRRDQSPNAHRSLAPRIRRGFTVLLLAVCLAPSFVAFAQENPANQNSATDKPATEKPATQEPATTQPPSPATRVNLESVSARLKAAEALEGQEELKAKLVPLLKTIEAFLKEEESLARKAETFRFDPQQLEATAPPAEPETPDRNREAEIRSRDDLTVLRAERDVLSQELVEKSNQLKAVDSWEQVRRERLEAIPRELTVVRQKLEALQQPPAPPENESPEVVQARRDAWRAELQMNQQLQNTLLLEQKYYSSESVTQRKTQEKTAVRRAIDRLGQLIEVYRKRIAQLEVRAATDLEQKINTVLKNVPPNLKPRIEEIRERASARTGSGGLIQRAQILQKQLDDSIERLKSLNAHRTSTESYLEYISSSESLASLLDAQRALIPSERQHEQEILAHSHELAIVRSQLPELKRDIDGLSNIDSLATEIADELNPNGSEDLRRETLSVLELELEVLQALQDDLEKNALTLSSLITAKGELIRFANDYHQYLDSKSMWVRVSKVYSWDHVTRAVASCRDLFRVEPWRRFVEMLGVEIHADPVSASAILLAFFLFLLMHSRLKKRLTNYHAQVSSEILAPFSLSLRAFELTLVLALWIPGLLGIVAYRISQLEPEQSPAASKLNSGSLNEETRGLVGADDAFVSAIGESLLVLALLVGILRLVSFLCRPQGLGEVHFRWPKARLLRVRRNLRWLTWSILPVAFFLVLVQTAGNSAERDSLGRGLLSIALLLSAMFMYRVMAPLRPSDARSSRVVLSLHEKIVVYAPVMVPIFLVLLTLVGYSATTPKLTVRLVESGVVILLLVMLNEMAFRWLYIARGKLALEQARQRQEAREQAQAESGEEIQPAADAKPTGLDLSAINAQTRNLLTTTFRLAVFITLWMLWNDVTPRLGILDYQLWSTNQLIQVAQTATGESSAETLAEASSLRWITLGDVLLFVLILTITILASRNLPGLLEVTVLQNLPLDTGVRYAAGMIARYCVLAVGILIALGGINLGVTQLSFVLGGLAVGLGFGLQELFANFVSGIILLFEQPLRIGDLVSVGDVTGTVTRIRIRATTITDWDRKEYIVPNKELITGTFRNWTLSDSVNRVVIEVGVAYGSNTDQARKILVDICRQHPRILEEPAPSATFDLFGGSALNLTLRCFLSDFENRLNTIHELHTMIDRRFKQAGIEIAFPQMDLHLRSIDKTVEPLPLRQPDSLPPSPPPA